MTIDTGVCLPDADQVALYLRNNLNQFPLNRLEKILHGEVPTILFERGASRALIVNGEVDPSAVEAYFASFMQTVLNPLTDLCGLQLEQKPEADLPLYHLFAHFWGTVQRYNFATAVEILKNGLHHHGDSAQLHVDIAYNYLHVAQAAALQQNWNAALANCKIGKEYLNQGFLLDPKYNPSRIVEKLSRGHDVIVDQAEKELRLKGAA